MAKKKKELTLREHLSTIQSAGGKALWANLTPEERSAKTRKAVEARWAKARSAAVRVTRTSPFTSAEPSRTGSGERKQPDGWRQVHARYYATFSATRPHLRLTGMQKAALVAREPRLNGIFYYTGTIPRRGVQKDDNPPTGLSMAPWAQHDAPAPKPDGQT
jgi:hypothetical protein